MEDAEILAWNCGRRLLTTDLDPTAIAAIDPLIYAGELTPPEHAALEHLTPLVFWEWARRGFRAQAEHEEGV